MKVTEPLPFEEMLVASCSLEPSAAAESGFWELRAELEAVVGARLTTAMLYQAGASAGASLLCGAVRGGHPGDPSDALRDVLSACQSAGLGRFELEHLDWSAARAVVRLADGMEASIALERSPKRDARVCAYTSGVLVGVASLLCANRTMACIERSCRAAGAGECVFEILPSVEARDGSYAALAPDPTLGWQPGIWESLFDQMPMGIAVLDRNLTLRRFNLTWLGFFNQYNPGMAKNVVPGADFLYLLGNESTLRPMLDRTLAGELVRVHALPLEEVPGVVSYWDVVFAPVIEGETVVGVVDLTHDVTERQHAEARLRERERQYRDIFDSTTDALLILALNGKIVEANPAACKMYGYSYKELIGLSWRDITHPDSYHLFADFARRVKAGKRVHSQAVNLRRNGVAIRVEVHAASFGFRGESHVLAVVRDVTGRMQAYQTLEEQVVKRTRELETLLDVAAAASSSLALDEMLGATLNRLVLLVGASWSGVLLREGEASDLRFRMMHPQRTMGAHESAHITSLATQVIEAGRPIYTGEARPLALLPLRSRGKALGVLGIGGSPEATFSSQQITLFETIADHLGVAIENARLYEQAEQAAAVEERQRLARELHDSVTQSLYSVTLFAEAGRRLVGAGDMQRAQEYLERLSDTALEALREMRLLVYELRPGALEQQGLVGALRHRLDAVEMRAGVDANLEVDLAEELPPAVEEGLYRIANEALNNALKHAAATRVTMRIVARDDWVELQVLDNGKGMSTEAARTKGGMGLANMRERAERLGGRLSLESRPGEGTRVTARLTTRDRSTDMS